MSDIIIIIFDLIPVINLPSTITTTFQALVVVPCTFLNWFQSSIFVTHATVFEEVNVHAQIHVIVITTWDLNRLRVLQIMVCVFEFMFIDGLLLVIVVHLCFSHVIFGLVVLLVGEFGMK
jgi:hypothetical protein